MEHAFYQRYEGPISGLRLPLKTWEVLRRQNITTIGALRAAADRIQRFEGIGPKSAQLIREEIVRVTAPKEQPLAGLIPDLNNTHGTA
jgi:DNA-directed RNA polymerase alpha subunit